MWLRALPPATAPTDVCPAYFNYVNAVTNNLDGFDGVTWEKLGVQTVTVSEMSDQ